MQTSHLAIWVVALASHVIAHPQAGIRNGHVEKRDKGVMTIWQEVVVTTTIFASRPSPVVHSGGEHRYDAGHYSIKSEANGRQPTIDKPIQLKAAKEATRREPESSAAVYVQPTAQTGNPRVSTTGASVEASHNLASSDSNNGIGPSSIVSMPEHALASAAAPSPASSKIPTTQGTGRFPFSALVAFGDNLSDNGNGSYAHHVADKNNPDNAIYGARTWTNQQVAVSFLTDLLGVPMNQNFAFGHANGGADFGATIDNSIACSDFHDPAWAAELGAPGAPPASQQIDTYIKGGVHKEAMHFLWIGNNDINIAHAEVGWDNSKFAANVSEKISGLVETLIDHGAPYVFVANLYPKHLSPYSWSFFGYNDAEKQDAYGVVINEANAALETALNENSKLTGKVIYYDVFGYMSSVWKDASSNGITNLQDTNGYPAFCDGDPNKTQLTENALAAGTIPVKTNPTGNNNWGLCVDLHGQETFYWMEYLDMTSKVHKLVASDMAARVSSFFSR